MAALVEEAGSLEKKFFDLVVHPKEQNEEIKPPTGPDKKVPNQDKKHRPLHRSKPVWAKKFPTPKKEEPTVPLETLVVVSRPLHIQLTPNPSASVLQCRVESEVKDSERSALNLKQLLKENLNTTDVVVSEKKDETEKVVSVPQVIELGLAGVFELIRETVSEHKTLCCKALTALLNMLQGQKLEGMKNEPDQVLENLFQILLELSRLPPDGAAEEESLDDLSKTSLPGIGPLADYADVSCSIPSLASSCLLSLVFAWGNTGKILAVVTSFIADCSNQKSPLFIKIPLSFVELQQMVTAAVLKKDHLPLPYKVGINKSAVLETWSIEIEESDVHLLSVQCDSCYLYCLLLDGQLLKIGTGYNATVEGRIYKRRSVFDLEGCSKSSSNDPSQLFYADRTLYLLTSHQSLYSINCNTLKEKFICSLPVLSGIWYSDNQSLCCMTKSGQEDAYKLNSYSLDSGKTVMKQSSLKIQPTQKHLLTFGNSLGFSPFVENSSDNDDIVQICVGKDFSISRNSSGSVFYAGKSELLGLGKTRSRRAVVPEPLPLSSGAKISHISVAPDGGHAILITDAGVTFFVGTSRRGEDGEPVKSRRPPQPQKPKLMKSMFGKYVVTGCCNAWTSALVTKDGKLYLFGKDSTQADSKTGLVSSLHNVHVKDVGLGKAHVVVLSNDGRIWTAGVNNKGQCGRQEGTIPMAQRLAEVEQERDVSMPDDKSMDEVHVGGGDVVGDGPNAPICSPDKHKWRKDVCMVCAVCCECTGYGPGCVNSSLSGRYPATPCGCGAGPSGCAKCGCCKTCAGEADINQEGKRKEKWGYQQDMGIASGVEQPSLFLHKLASFYRQKKKHKPAPSARDANKGLSAQIGPETLTEASKMALLPIQQIRIDKNYAKPIQIACGAHHTLVLLEDGKVCGFGQNTHGHLGLGDKLNRNSMTHIPIPEKIQQVAVGSHHSLFLSTTGVVYGCGCNDKNQLGDKTPLLDGSTDILTPTKILEFQLSDKGNPPRASWISASHTTTFIEYEEVLLSFAQLQTSHIFADTSFVGISYRPVEQSSSKKVQENLLLIDKHSGGCRLLDNKDHMNLCEGELACVDPSHNIIWRVNSDDLSVRSYSLSGSEHKKSKLLPTLLPELAISLQPGSLVTRTQAGLNLLACIDTLVTRCPTGMMMQTSEEQGPENVKSQKKKTKEPHTADEYNAVNRFKSHGGGWGYSVHSTEAIRFMCDTDVLLGGIGVFGGRGEYSVIVSLYEEVGELDLQGDGELLVETDRTPYECGFREKFHALFDEPALISAGQWYTITAKISGPSSDCGSHGKESVTTSDDIKFSFRRSKRSNNGTDVSSGQIPELLYTLPTVLTPVESAPVVQPSNVLPIQQVSKEFFMNFNETVFDTLPYILEWSRTSLFMDVSKKSSRYEEQTDKVVTTLEQTASKVIKNLSYVFTSCLRLLRVAITQSLSSSGRELDFGSTNLTTQFISLIEAILTDGELDAALEDSRLMPLSDQELVVTSAVTMVTECHRIMLECMEMLHPSPPQKWNYLYQALENYNTSSGEKRPRASRLLVAVLDALCQPSINLVQCLPLFPRTFSNLESIASAAQSPCIDPDLPGPAQTPVLTSAAGFYEVANLLVEIACSPARILVHLEKDNQLQLSHTADNHAFFSSFLLDPVQALVKSACTFLITLTSDLAYKACDNAKNLQDEKNKSRQFIHQAQRFEKAAYERSWNTGNGSPDALSFSVDSDGINIVGFGVFGGGKEKHKYELELLEQIVSGGDKGQVRWETMDIVKGSYSAQDCGADHVTNIKLSKPVPILKNQIYAVCLHNFGERTFCGEQGQALVKGDDGTTFFFSHCSQCSNGSSVSRGQFPVVLYQRAQDDDLPTSPSDKWIGTATTPAKATLTYQRHALNILALVTEATVEVLNSVSCVDDNDLMVDGKDMEQIIDEKGDRKKEETSVFGKSEMLVDRIRDCARNVLSSELVSYLLPQLFSDIGVLVKRNANCAVEVMDLIRDLLPPLINVQQLAQFDNNAQVEKAKTYTVTVESSHPYKLASVSQNKVSFPESVKWMVVQFSHKCQTAQREDFLQLYLVDPVQNSLTNMSEGTTTKVSSMKSCHAILQKMYQDKNWPQKALLLPGHEMIFSLETASDYTNSKDQKPALFYGFHCTVTGYEDMSFSNKSEELVNKLVNTAGLCAVNLMTVHDQLWNDNGESNISASLDDKIEHLKVIESSAAVTLEQHSSLFLPGLHLNNFPGASEALTGNLPINDGSKEKKFLLDFVTATPDTSGGRLARWLQPDSYVDPKHCILQLNLKTLFHTLPTSVTIITRDQYGNAVHVPTLKVELSAKPQPSSHYLPSDVAANYDISPSEPSPTFDAQYEPTKHRDSRYHSISMMRAYKKYSFEELRLAYPLKRTLKTENILVASVGNGIYRATWIPTCATTYALQVTLDQQLRGPRQIVEVSEAPQGSTERPQHSGATKTLQKSTGRFLKFATKNSRGLRIRSDPTLQSPQSGLLEFGDIIEYVDETRNSDGNWVKLSEASTAKFCKQARYPEAWCISYHKHNGRTFLVPVDVADKPMYQVDRSNEPPSGEQSLALLPTPIQEAPSSSKFIKSPFASSGSASGRSPVFSSPFAIKPPVKDDIEWVEKVPGSYALVKCGSSGHNVRYKPSLKATPVGKLAPGSCFTAVRVLKNKSGTWLAVHESDATKFCEESYDSRFAWTLAVSHDGTLYIQSTEGAQILPKLLNKISPTVNMNSLITQEKPIEEASAAIRGALLAKMTNPFNNAPPGGQDSEVVDLLVAAPSAVPEKSGKIKVDKKLVKNLVTNEVNVAIEKVKGHSRSSSDSTISFKNSTPVPQLPAGKHRESSPRGRSRNHPQSRISSTSRSHSSPSSRRTPRTSNSLLASSSSSKISRQNGDDAGKHVSAHKASKTSRKKSKDVDEYVTGNLLKYTSPKKKQSDKKISGLSEILPPANKVIRGGNKKQIESLLDSAKLAEPSKAVMSCNADDIPFIDDVVDVEGNILSPTKVNGEILPPEPAVPAKVVQSKPTIPTSSFASPKNVNEDKKHFIKETSRKKIVEEKTPKKSMPTTALSPLVAESSRSVFAAFLWHEGIAHDAMACASYLKFNQTHRCHIMEYINQGFLSKDENTADHTESDEWKECRPPDTLVYLALFWDKLSDTVTKIAVRNQNLPPPTPVNHNLNSSKMQQSVVKPAKRQSPEVVANDANDPEMMIKVPPLKRKAYQRHYFPQLAQARMNAQQLFLPHHPPQPGELAVDHFKDTMCDLCDNVHPYPVTYHMKQAHPGCSKYAGGLGYNSSGHYCGGWAGECGDGGIGGSTWYLLCVDCRGKYMASKTNASGSSKKDDVKNVGDWKKQFHRVLTQPANAHQIMKSNSMFLLDLVSSSNGSTQCIDIAKQTSTEPQEKWREETVTSKDLSWDNIDLLPLSKFSHCPFPAVPCSYLLNIGEAKQNPQSNQQHVNKLRSSAEYRNRSLSSQVTPSSGHFKGILQRLSITPEATPLKSETKNFYRRSRLLRSVSTGSQPSDQKAKHNNNEDLSTGTGSHLLHHPSPSMLKLMKLCENNNIASEVVSHSSILAFVTQRHDLKSLHLTLQMTLRRAALRVYVLQALTWLLRTVCTENCIHDILWYFVCALAETDMTENKNETQTTDVGGSESTDEDIEETKALCQHPVKHMALAGLDSMKPLVEAFHGFLQTVADMMMHLPANSPVQLMAIRCWSLRVLPSDHHFLHESQVFSHISQILSKVDLKDNNGDVTPMKKKLVKIKPKSSSYVPVASVDDGGVVEPKVVSSQDLTSKVHIKTSSHSAIASSLTDGSTETFWESGDEDKNKPKSITVDLLNDKDGHKKKDGGLLIEDIYVHVDNTRDVQKKVMSVSFWSMSEEDDWKKIVVKELNVQFAGWVQFSVPADASKFKIELRGPDNGLRVRQIKVLGYNQVEGPKLMSQLSAKLLQSQTCEAELLKVFKLLTAEVFGQLLSEETSSTATNSASTPTSGELPADVVKPLKDDVLIPSTSATPASPRDVDPNLREHMVGILFSRSKLTTLQKKVFEHTVQAIHNETSHIRKTWEFSIDTTVSVALAPRTIDMDSYCFELLSMILALTGSDVGRHYVAQQSVLIEDMISLLHTGSPRIQRQVTLLLRRILSEVTPARLASILEARVPTQDKLTESMSGTSSSSSLSDSPEKSESRISILDPLLTCISKSLSVQVKRAAPVEHQGNGDGGSAVPPKPGKRTQSITMDSIFTQRPVVDGAMWWLHGTMKDKTIVEAIMKLLLDMAENQISPQWCSATKCAVSESLLALTRLSDAEREADTCLNNPTLWRALAALCVLNHDHVEKLSSAKSAHNKNKLTCENHDDGATPAIIQCNECGNLCSECDRYLHLHRRTRSHQRQIFKEEEEAIRVDLHEGCGRIKLFWFKALADSNTLKAMVEFKGRSTGQMQLVATDACRFCGNACDNTQLVLSNVCSDKSCQKYATAVCAKTHPCGHLCGGVKDEETCLLCLYSSCNPGLNQDADDMCMVCFTDALSAAPAIQLKCGHIFHHHCCQTQLQKQWAGPRITFGFLLCSICKNEISHPALESVLKPLRELMQEVKRKALQRLEYEGLKECESITTVGGKFYKDPTGFALNKYAYYMCCNCNKAYYGGEVRCDAEADGNLFDPKELICGACSDVSCAQICPKHGTDFLEYKCRYCCSVAVYFCFGTTHFCQPCHDDFQRITGLPKNELPHCPAGHKARQLEGKECPLHVQHPPTGEEFALGCGVCRNAHTF
uniref:RCR-type E3 ubiquitin transferase n=1 Tax=Phallusia mammillata TaxID=59560 RepID=A0A6F9DKY3_9ASCI|nr:E3 ubiquitin-protein ligase MYCBP2 [Phallusia mammillata]